MNLPPPGTFISTGIALLAFVVAFYVLLARERKTPYIINFIFKPAGMLLLGIFLSFLAGLFAAPSSMPSSIPPSSLASPSSAHAESRLVHALTVGAAVFLAAGLLMTIFNIGRLHNRQVHFRDDHAIQNTTAFRYCKRKFRQIGEKSTYAHTEVQLDVAAIRHACTTAGIDLPNVDDQSSLRTIAICEEPLRKTDPQLAKLCAELIQTDWYVQYTTCIRHPWEFAELLKSTLGTKWNEFSKRIVIVDAFTPHFGFTDSIHEEKTVQIRKIGVNYVSAKESYAGVHTAAARAFNALKDLDKFNRRPTVVIYEGANALADLESTVQYRIFARHVLSSERMWGGMLTFFVEPTIALAEMNLLRTYADSFISPAEAHDG